MNTDNDDWGVLSELPGNPIMWLLILSDLVIFGVFFVALSFVRFQHPEMVLAGQATLSIPMGGANTLILITSGYFAARAVQARAASEIKASRWWLVGAGMLGGCFLVIKGFEYADKAAQGIDIDTNTFWTLFYLMTGFHAIHVLVGIVVLAIVGWKSTIENLETGTAFWHMVDLIWLILFPLVYLLR